MQRTKSGRWQVRWRERGKHRAKTFPTKPAARRFEAELELGEADTSPNESGITFAEYANQWHTKYCKVHKSESQWAGDLGMITNHLIPSFGDIPIRELVKADGLDLRATLKNEKNLSAKTINNVFSLSRKILETAVDMDLLKTNPFAGIKPLKVPPQPFGYWTAEERDRFLTYCKREDPELWGVVAFACHTGLRAGEIRALQRSAINYDWKAIIVSQSYDHKLRKVLPYTKGKTIRQLTMNSVVFEILKDRRMMRHDDFVFKKNLSHASRQMKPIIKLAGVREIRFHDLRHTFASCLAMQGVAMHKIQILMGHKSIKDTLRYSHLHPDSLEDLTESLVREMYVQRINEVQDAVITW